MSSRKKQSAFSQLSVKAREARLYAKVFRFLAILLGLIGFIMSAMIYNTTSGGDYHVFSDRPVFIFYLLAPFIPAFVLGLISASKAKQFNKLAQNEGKDIKALRKDTDMVSHEEATKK